VIRGRDGFSLVEIMITLAILGIVLASAGTVFNSLLEQYKQQSKVAETGMERIIGLEILRRDVEQAGYGLPWNMGLLGSYTEAAENPHGLNDAPGNPPRAIVSADGGADNPDYLVIKSASVSGEDAGRKWTTLRQGDVKRDWTPDSEDLAPADRVIVLQPGFDDTTFRTLVCPNASTFSTTFNNTSAFVPALPEETHIVYGLGSGAPARPFNRADYYIDTENVSVPQRCAPGTGVLVKAVLNTGGTFDLFPLLDCVADFQVSYLLDTTGDGVGDTLSENSSVGGSSALDIRNDLRQVRLDILAHEGQRDNAYTHGPSSIEVGVPGVGGGRSVDISPNPNYRWKVYTLAVSPDNLR
jgi:prepilin-type N-terminal cleavage/methylation domain-containing protein